jgi:hypothetical protein
LFGVKNQILSIENIHFVAHFAATWTLLPGVGA